MINEMALLKMWAFADAIDSKAMWGRVIDRCEGVALLVSDLSMSEIVDMTTLMLVAFGRQMEAKK